MLFDFQGQLNWYSCVNDTKFSRISDAKIFHLPVKNERYYEKTIHAVLHPSPTLFESLGQIESSWLAFSADLTLLLMYRLVEVAILVQQGALAHVEFWYDHLTFVMNVSYTYMNIYIYIYIHIYIILWFKLRFIIYIYTLVNGSAFLCVEAGFARIVPKEGN